MSVTETMILVVAAVSLVSMSFALVVTTRRASNSIAQVMAACAESNRQFMVYSEKAINRTMAAANPMSYRSLRETSGTIEGAQAPVEGHYEKPPREKRPAVAPRPVPHLSGVEPGELNGMFETPKHVGSALDFEENGGNR